MSSAQSYASSCMPMALRSVGEALQLDQIGKTKEAYCQYLSCAVFILQSLKEDGWSYDISVLGTQDTGKMYRIIEKCLTRAKDIVMATPDYPGMLFPSTYDSNHSLNDRPRSPSSNRPPSPSFNRSSSPTSNRLPSITMNQPSSNVLPPQENDNIHKLIMALPTPPGSTSGSIPIRRRTSSSVGPKGQIQTQQMFNAYQRRKMLHQSQSRQRATNASLEAIRRMAENNALKKTREEALAIKIKKRQQRAKETAERRFADHFGGHVTNKGYKQQIYAKILEFEQDMTWPQSLRSRIQSNPEDVDLICYVVVRILRSREHPLGSLIAELQYLLYCQVAPLVKDFKYPSHLQTSQTKAQSTSAGVTGSNEEVKTSVIDGTEETTRSIGESRTSSTASQEDNSTNSVNIIKTKLDSRSSLSHDFQAAYEELDDDMWSDDNLDDDDDAGQGDTKKYFDGAVEPNEKMLNGRDDTMQQNQNIVSGRTEGEAYDVDSENKENENLEIEDTNCLTASENSLTISTTLETEKKDCEVEHANLTDTNEATDDTEGTEPEEHTSHTAKDQPCDIECRTETNYVDQDGKKINLHQSLKEEEKPLCVFTSDTIATDTTCNDVTDNSKTIDDSGSKMDSSQGQIVTSNNDVEDSTCLQDSKGIEPINSAVNDLVNSKTEIEKNNSGKESEQIKTTIASIDGAADDTSRPDVVNRRSVVPAVPPEWSLITTGELDQITANLKTEEQHPPQPFLFNTLDAPSDLSDALNSIVKDTHEALDLLHSLLLITFTDLECPTGRDQSYATLERIFFEPVWPWLNLLFRKVNAPKEERFHKVIQQRLSDKLADFNVREQFWLTDTQTTLTSPNTIPYIAAITELKKVITMSAPLDKLECAVRTSRIICSTIDDFWQKTKCAPPPSIGCDDLLPILIYVIIQSDMPQLVSECHAMEEFIHEGYLMGEEGYCLTTISTALAYLMS